MSVTAALKEKLFRKGDQEKYDSSWMNPENILVSEGNQTQKTTFCMILFTRNVENRQIRRNRR